MSRFAIVVVRWQYMRQEPFILALLLALIVASVTVTAQVPRLLSIPIYLEEGGVPVNGQRTLDIRWYDAAAGGTLLLSERVDATIEMGIATLTLGATVVIDDTLLLRGPIWLGISIDGGPELIPRTFLSSVPYALVAQRALIAEELAPEVTGVVTSLNELGGAIRLIGGMGVVVRRDGANLQIDVSRTLENGTTDAVAGEHRYTITPLTILEPNISITAEVVAATHISTRIVDVDVVNNTFTIETSAPLTVTERVRWQLIR